jgi:hypothetical protein
MNSYDYTEINQENTPDTAGTLLKVPREEPYQSPFYAQKEGFAKDLFASVERPESSPVIPNPLSGLQAAAGEIWITGWRNIENISSRVIEIYDSTVVLECLIDKEASIYEEREFLSTLFEGNELTIGSLFYLRFFKRKNEIKMEIHNDPEDVLSADFPKMDFSVFKSSKLFQKRTSR